MRLLVLINPHASRAEDALPRLRQWFDSLHKTTVVATKSHRELDGVLRERGPEADRVVIGGGDGTLCAALPALLTLDKPLAVLPLGTANDFARTLSLPDRPLAAARLAVGGREHRVDVGLANRRPFLNVASIGIASRVSQAQNAERKRSWAKLSYLLTLQQVITDARPFHVSITLDHQRTWQGMAHQVSVGNGRFHGGGLVVAEDAAIDDGKLNIYVVQPGTALQLLACVTTLKLGFGRLEGLKHISAERVIVGTHRKQPVNVDGDIRTETPLDVSILRRALKVIIPERLPSGQRGLVEV